MSKRRFIRICLAAVLLFSVTCSGPADTTHGSLETKHLKLAWEGEKITISPTAGGRTWQFDLATSLRVATGPPGHYVQEWSIDFGMDEHPEWADPGPVLEAIEQPGRDILCYSYSVNGTNFSISFRPLADAPELEVIVSADTSGEQVVTDIEVPGDCVPEGGEITTFLMPQMQGIAWQRDMNASFMQNFRVYKRVVGLLMPFYMVQSGDDWMMCIYRTPDDAAVTICKEKGDEPEITPRFYSSLKSLRYERKLSYRFEHDSGYPELCKIYRDRFVKPDGNYKTLAEKVAERPNLEKALGAPYVFIGGSNQSPDTIMAALDTLKAMGYDRALVVSLMRYSPAGKDIDSRLPAKIHRFPELAAPVRALGYLPSGWLLLNHYTKGGPGYDPDKVARTGDGSIIRCWRIGKKLEWQALLPDLIVPELKKEEHEWISLDGFHFDTGASSGLYEMFSTDGRVFTRSDDKKHRIGYFKYFTDRGKVNLSEGAQTWCVPYLDVGSVNGFGDWLEEGFHYDLVPLWHLVFHECVQGMWWEGKSYQASHFRKRFLCDISWGCPPTISPIFKSVRYNARDADSELVPFGWNFLRPDGKEYKEQIRESVAVYHFARKVAGAEMTDHAFLDNERQVTRSEFSTGHVAYVNFGGDPFKLPDGRTVEGESYLIDEPQK
ncbi:MAG: hypothetical protein U9P14_06850 [Gemmatimonadota bacterium]|nr:hypothetical protein [Gemmatimonadota bacterium]